MSDAVHVSATTSYTAQFLPIIGRLGPLIALILLFVTGSILSDSFLTADNLLNVLTRSAIIGIIAIGATFVITAGGLDLSVGAMAALVAGISILLMNALVSTSTLLAFGVGILAALALGAGAGAINGTLIVTGRVEAFIVTLGTMGIMRSLLTWLSDGGSISLDFGLRDVSRFLYYGTIFWIPVPIFVFAVLAVGAEIVLSRFRFGRHAPRSAPTRPSPAILQSRSTGCAWAPTSCRASASVSPPSSTSLASEQSPPPQVFSGNSRRLPQ